jgi:6-hydroxycyclohex-1-ene-1-carbonyl-CoA dehydrogenase
VAIDVDDERLSEIANHGAGLTINSATTEFKELKKRVVGQAQAWGCSRYGWKIFECSGHPDGQRIAWGCLTHAATLVVIGFTLAPIEVRLSNVMAFDATVQGTWGCLPELYPAALALVTGGRITLKPFIERHPMSRGLDVLQRVADHALRRRAILEPDWHPLREAAGDREPARRAIPC